MFEQFGFAKDYHNVTTVHPVGLVALAIAVVAVMLVPRRHVILPIIVVACAIAPAQRLAVFDMDFTFIRIAVVAAWIRVLLRGEHRDVKPMVLDRVIVAWVGFSAAAYLLLFPNGASVMFQLGVAFDALATYFLVRVVVRDASVFTALARGAALLALPVAAAMTYEGITGNNLFSVFGGVPEQTLERQGRYRAQAAFAHPIIAGTFWATMIPLILSGIRRDIESIVVTLTGVAAACVIVWCCSSSTPVILVAMLVPACMLFPIRRIMPWLRVGTAAAVVGLHLVMLAPVWHLFARINFFPGSTGWWRYLIIDRFVTNWDAWILMGTRNSQAWLGDNMFVDITNQYVTEGINGGIIKLALFIAMIALALRAVGQAIRAREGGPTIGAGSASIGTGSASSHVWIAWCVGMMMCVHMAAYFATAYFGQLVTLQYITLGLAASVPVAVGHTIRQVRTIRVDAAPARGGAASSPVRGMPGGTGAGGGTGGGGTGGTGGIIRPALFRPV